MDNLPPGLIGDERIWIMKVTAWQRIKDVTPVVNSVFACPFP